MHGKNLSGNILQIKVSVNRCNCGLQINIPDTFSFATLSTLCKPGQPLRIRQTLQTVTKMATEGNTRNVVISFLIAIIIIINSITHSFFYLSNYSIILSVPHMPMIKTDLNLKKDNANETRKILASNTYTILSHLASLFKRLGSFDGSDCPLYKLIR